MKGLDDVARELIGIFEAENVPYALMGGFAVRIHAAQATGWVDTVQGLPVVKLQAILADRAIDVDIFLAESAFQRQLLTRRQRHGIDGFSAWFVSPEDLILLKLIAGQPKDRLDVADVLFIQGQLDEDYLRHWAAKLDVSAPLEDALRGARETQ